MKESYKDRKTWVHLTVLSLLALTTACEVPTDGSASGNTDQSFIVSNRNGKMKATGKAVNNFQNIESAIITLQKGLIRNINGDFYSFYEQNQAIDLMKLAGGNESILFKAQLPDGDYDHIRLIVTSEPGIITFKDGSVAPFTIPSGSQTGLKLFFDPIRIQNGTITKIVLEIDVDRSFVALGNGSYHFKPVLHLETKQYEDSNPSDDIEDPSEEPCDDFDQDLACDDDATDPTDDDPIYYPPITTPEDPSGVGV